MGRIGRGDEEIYPQDEAVGEHNGEILLCFELNDRNHNMEGVETAIERVAYNYDSEDDVNEMVDNVFERLEPYL